MDAMQNGRESVSHRELLLHLMHACVADILGGGEEVYVVTHHLVHIQRQDRSHNSAHVNASTSSPPRLPASRCIRNTKGDADPTSRPSRGESASAKERESALGTDSSRSPWSICLRVLSQRTESRHSFTCKPFAIVLYHAHTCEPGISALPRQRQRTVAAACVCSVIR